MSNISHLKKEKQIWFIVAISSLALSIILFFVAPVIIYGNEKFYLFDLLSNKHFESEVLQNFHGKVLIDIDEVEVTILVIISIVAVICAVVGLISLRAQRPNTWQFVLTIVGLIGTVVPSAIVIFCAISYKNSFDQTFSCGVPPIITPIAIIISIIAVCVRRKKTNRDTKKIFEEGLIRRGGDLY